MTNRLVSKRMDLLVEAIETFISNHPEQGEELMDRMLGLARRQCSEREWKESVIKSMIRGNHERRDTKEDRGA